MIGNSHFITIDELKPYVEDLYNSQDYNKLAKALIRHQEDARNGFESLLKNLKIINKCLIKAIKIDSVEVQIMLNPVRKDSLLIMGSRGKMDKKECKLCNLYPYQKGIPIINSKYMILLNPMMTSRGDLTIASIEHHPQILNEKITDMTYIAKQLPDFSIFYNGLLAGASCPHFHFQAGFKNLLLGERQINNFINNRNNISKNKILKIIESNNIQVVSIQGFLRKNIIVITDRENALIEFFNYFNNNYSEISKNIKNFKNIPDFGKHIDSINMTESEGRMNLLLNYNQVTKKYFLVIFPKITNRPTFFYEEEPSRIILGMAIKEYLGLITTIRKSDFKRLGSNPLLIKKAYYDTTLPDELFDFLVKRLSKY